MHEPVRPVAPEDLPWAADAYRAEARVSGRTKWTFASPARAAYWLCLDRPDRGCGVVMDGSDGPAAFAGLHIRNEHSGEAELFGPYPHRDDAEPLVHAVEEEAARRGLRLGVWIGEHDLPRQAFFARLGYAKAFGYRWLRGVLSPLTREFESFASRIEIVDAKEHFSEYLRLYNDAFERHLGDHRNTDDDMRFRMADPLAQVSSYFLALWDAEPVGLIEAWWDYYEDQPPAEREGWVGNLAVAEHVRDNFEVHLALGSVCFSRLRDRQVCRIKGLLNAERSRLVGFYAFLGWRVDDEYACWQKR